MRFLSSFACVLSFVATAGCASTSHWQAVLGFHEGPPASFSAALGAARVLTRRVDSIPARAHTDTDVFALVEPGWRAGRASVGLGSVREHCLAKDFVNARVT